MTPVPFLPRCNYDARREAAFSVLLQFPIFTYSCCVRDPCASLTRAGILKEGGLVLEAFPATSVFLSKVAGRIPANSKLHYKRQTSSVLIAHKTADFPCHVASGRSQFEAPRQGQLEVGGVVVSSKHPASTTFLAPSMAEHLLTRSVS